LETYQAQVDVSDFRFWQRWWTLKSTAMWRRVHCYIHVFSDVSKELAVSIS